MIKFRAWDKSEKRYMVDEAIFINADGESFDYTDEAMVLNGWIIEQSTGLKDKNNTGVELFEGDVVYVAGSGNCAVTICPFMGVCFENDDVGSEPYHDALMDSDVGEKLGTIHENPELMEQS